MLRKLYKGVLVLAVLGAGPGALAAEAQNASTAVPAAGSEANSAAEADVWYKTAAYIFQHDQELQPIAGKLVAKLNKNSLESFRRSLEDATKAEGKPLNNSHVFNFQSSFKEIQAQQPASPTALVAAIQASKLGTKRKDDQQFQALMRSLAQTAGTGTALPANAGAAPATVPAASNPVNATSPAPLAPDAAHPAPASTPAPGLLLWLALGAAGMSLLGVAVLWNKLANTREKLATLRRTVEVLGQKPAGSASPLVLTNAIKQEITRQMDQRVLEKQAKSAVVPAAVSVPVPAPVAVPVPASAVEVAPAHTPRLRTQYVGEAPFNNIFPARALSDQPSTYSMFAIESSEEQPDQGTFAVTGNLASHVRDHRTVLEPVCEYVGGSPLGSEMRVVTEQPGLVRRRGADWEVVQRARVRFE